MASRERALLDSNSPASPLSVPPSDTALILADYQNFIIGRAGPAGDATISSAASLRSWAQQEKIPVIVATIATDQLPLPQSKMSGLAGDVVELFKTRPELGEVHPDLENPEGSDPDAVSHHVARRLGLVSVLNSDGVGDLLKRLGTRSIIVAGISTSGCVLSTVRDANEHGYVVTVVEDACADPAPGVHEALVKHVLPMTASVLSLGELKEAWSRSG